MTEYSSIFTRIATPLRPVQQGNLSAILRDKDLSGGYRVVDSIEDRNNIPEYSEIIEEHLPQSNYRGKGMLVYVTEEEKTYRLGSGLTNNDWQEVSVSPSDQEYLSITIENKIETTINHGFNRKPTVQVVNESGDLVLCQIQHLNLDEVKISFSDYFTGTAIID